MSDKWWKQPVDEPLPARAPSTASVAVALAIVGLVLLVLGLSTRLVILGVLGVLLFGASLYAFGRSRS